MDSKMIFVPALLVVLALLFGCVEQPSQPQQGATITFPNITVPNETAPPEATAPNITPPATQPTANITLPQETSLANLSGIVTLADLNALPKDVTAYFSNNSYFVATGGDDGNNGTLDQPFATMTHALEIAKDGDAVFVRAGNYSTGTLMITQSNFTLAAYNGESVTLRKAGDGTGMKVDGQVSDVVVDGFALEGFDTGIIYGNPQTQKSLVFKNLRISDGGTGIENDYPQHTDYLVDGLLIKNVTMENITGLGVNCGDEQYRCAKNVLLQDVRVYEAAGQPDDTGYDTLAMVQSDNILVLDSVFSGAPGDGMDFKSSRVSIVNSMAAAPNRNGIKLWHDGEIINSVVYDTGADAAIVFDPGVNGTEFRLINSIVARHLIRAAPDQRYSYAMTLGYDKPGNSSVEIRNSIIYDMPGPIYINNESGVNITGNVFYQFIHDDGLVEYAGEKVATIDELNNRSYAKGNVYADPEFTDPANHDFSLLPGSPAISMGAGLG